MSASLKAARLRAPYRLFPVIACLVVPLLSVSASATPYWVSYDPANGLPENNGWERFWGNWEGPYMGEAVRTIEDGVLTYNSLHDEGVFDGNFMEPTWAIDPGEGLAEQFVMEWRLKVDQVTGIVPHDPNAGVRSDEGWGAAFEFTETGCFSTYESYLFAPYTPHVHHDFRMVSSDMRGYELYIDGALALVGVFLNVGATRSDIAWGDGVQGAASLHHWGYFRYGVTPEVSSSFLLVALLAFQCGGRR